MTSENLLKSSLALAASLLVTGSGRAADAPLDIGSRRELFVDQHLIGRLDRVSLHLHEPRDEGAVLKFDEPWEGLHSGY
ncbi:MAG: hypothetical protein ABMA26_23920, partial [Limisphaerales bacterium]